MTEDEYEKLRTATIEDIGGILELSSFGKRRDTCRSEVIGEKFLSLGCSTAMVGLRARPYIHSKKRRWLKLHVS